MFTLYPHPKSIDICTLDAKTFTNPDHMAGVCEVRSEERVHYISSAQLQHYFITFLSSAFRPRSPRVPESVGPAS